MNKKKNINKKIKNIKGVFVIYECLYITTLK